MEATQVRLTLTDDKTVLAAMKRRGIYKGEKPSLTCRFDGTGFVFSPGVIITLDKSVADALYREYRVIVDTDDNGEFIPMLKKVLTYRVGEEGRTPEEKTICPICNLQCQDPVRLGRHITATHTKADLTGTAPVHEIESIEVPGEEA